MKVYAVCFSDYEDHWVEGAKVYVDYATAFMKASVLQLEHIAKHQIVCPGCRPQSGYEVEEYEVVGD